MKALEVKIISVDEMINLGYIIGSISYPNLVIGLNGDLGAGKTVFTKGIGKYLGVKRVINSPTFTIMKIYDTNNETINNLYHLDVYRLDSADADFELEEYFYLDGLTIIEWSKIILDILPKDMWNVEINILSENERNVKLIVEDEVFEILLKKLLEEKYEVIY